MDWGTFLANTRADLKDTGTSPKYADSLIYLYMTDALRDYSRWFPRRVDRASLTLSGDSYPLPSDYIRAIAVESPQDRFLEERRVGGGLRYRAMSPALVYYIDGGSLYLMGDPHADGVFLTYHSTHTAPADENDTSFVLTVPDQDLELIRIFVKAKCLGQTRSRQSSLDRFELSAGDRRDNPLRPEVQTLMDEYHARINERIPGGVVRLVRSGRRA